MEQDYRAINRAHWDERASAHARSPGYGLAAFSEAGYLSKTVRFDRPRLDDIAGLTGLHLQCHIGTDTVSLARLGARMTGLDFSPAALAEARQLSETAGTSIDFHEADVYKAAELLGRARFDLVYTGIGALCWLPDIRAWAAVVADLLRPGGRLFLREAHPVLWTIAEVKDDDQLRLEYPYFEVRDPVVLSYPGTYVETDATFSHNTTHEWNHGIGEIITALLDCGMTLTQFVEHDSIPWDAFPGRMERVASGEFRLAKRPERMPHSYTLQATKR